MTTPTMTSPEHAPAPPRRTIELVLAHMHLKLGSLELARVELETLAGIGGLDPQGLVDLAEVRWRTGDLLGAGEAAAAALRTDAPDPIALIVAAEAASAIGRPSEARRLSTQAITAAPDSIDAIFAGMPRSGVWAPDANEPLPSAPTLFDRGPETSLPREPAEAPRDEPPTAATAAKVATGPMTLGFWDNEDVAADDASGPDPAREFEAGRVALVSGAFDEAALRFGLALRLAPALAPAVLEATEGARASVLSVLRGDAYRLAGHEADARQAYAIAARGGLPERRSKVRPRPKPKPEATVPLLEEPDGAESPVEGEGAGEGEPAGEPAAHDESSAEPQGYAG